MKLENLLGNWDDYKVLFHDPVFLILDYDGTLTPIVSRPEDAKLSRDMEELLNRLVRVCPVAIVSGRSLDDLRSRVHVEKVYYSGNHGMRIFGPGIEFTQEEAKKSEATINRICNKIKSKISSIDGVLIENKGLTASIHYRLVEEGDIDRLKNIVEEEVSSYEKEGLLEVSHGKKVIEIRPGIEWDKGSAVSLLLSAVPFDEDTMPIYLGDDTTDEDAFGYLEDRGLGILISEKEKDSSADFRLNSVDEVSLFLKKLFELLNL